MKTILYIKFLSIILYSCHGLKLDSKQKQAKIIPEIKKTKPLLNSESVIQFENNKIFSFSDYVIKSKVSIFIIGSEYCKPCKILEKEIKDKYYNNSKINLIKINVPIKGDKSYESLSYKVFRDIDGLSEIQPTTVIFSPSRNQYSKYRGLKTELVLNDIETLKKFCK